MDVVFHPLNITREYGAEAVVKCSSGLPKVVQMVRPDGNSASVQISGDNVIFEAAAPSAGYALYDLLSGDKPIGLTGGGIHKRMGWHTFRYSFGTLLKANGEDVKTVQELRGQANSSIRRRIDAVRKLAQAGRAKQGCKDDGSEAG